jgi:hypothetical protein
VSFNRKHTYWRANSHVFAGAPVQSSAISPSCDSLIAPFSWVLRLFMGFTLPVVYAKVQNMSATLWLTMA